MKQQFLFLVLVLAIFATLEIRKSESPSAPVQVAEQPKQSHHVVYFWVCDTFRGAVITTDPVVWIDSKAKPTPPELKLIIEAHSAKRVFTFRHLHGHCSHGDVI